MTIRVTVKRVFPRDKSSTISFFLRVVNILRVTILRGTVSYGCRTHLARDKSSTIGFLVRVVNILRVTVCVRLSSKDCVGRQADSVSHK